MFPDKRPMFRHRIDRDFFPDDSGREAHLSGKVAEALMAQADDLFSVPPDIQQADVIAA